MKTLRAAFFLIPVIASGMAHAGTAVASMDNVVTVVSACTIGATGFTTTYDPTGANASTSKDITASVSTICTNGSSVVVTLGQGLYSAVGSTDALPLRRLSTGGATPNFLNYTLHQDVGHTTAWGNTAGSGAAIVGTGSAVVNTIYARIPAGQTNATPGIYSDTVVVTVSF